MKFLSNLASVALATALSGPAVAAPVTYSFSGTLTDIRGTGAGISFGTAFNASYIHDDAPQAGAPIQPNRQLYSGGRYSISAGSLALVGSPAS